MANIMKAFSKIIITLGVALPLLTLAQGGIAPVAPKADVNLQTLINTVAGWATGLLIALSVLFVIYAAFIYLTAAGDEEKVKNAKNIIVYAAVAIAIALLSQLVKTIVTGIIG